MTIQKSTRATRSMAASSGKRVQKANAKTATSIARSAKAGRFVDGVKLVSERDREGLIKLADR